MKGEASVIESIAIESIRASSAGLPSALALSAICDMENLVGLPHNSPWIQETRGGGTGLEIGAF